MPRVHTQQKFNPNFTLDRHKPYSSAFRMQSNIQKKYYNHIIRFLRDEKLSPFDKEDIKIFRHFMFDSKFGIIYIHFMKHLLNNINAFNFKWTINVVSRHIDFLGKLSSINQIDTLDTLFKDYKDKDILNEVFRTLSPETKLIFLERATFYPALDTLIPKLGLYLLFS